MKEEKKRCGGEVRRATISAKMITDTDIMLGLIDICTFFLTDIFCGLSSSASTTIPPPWTHFENYTSLLRTGRSTLQPPVNPTTGTQQLATSTHTDIHADTQTYIRTHIQSQARTHSPMVALCSYLPHVLVARLFFFVTPPSAFILGRLLGCLWLFVVIVVVGVFRCCL